MSPTRTTLQTVREYSSANKWRDAVEIALEVAEALDRRGRSSWLDMWGMPGSVRELRAEMEPESLWTFIKSVAADCGCAVAICSAGYNEGGARHEFSILGELQESNGLILFEIHRASDLRKLDLPDYASGSMTPAAAPRPGA